MANEETIKGNWEKFQGEVKKSFGKLTNDELLKSKGDTETLLGYIVKQYGITKQEAKEKWDDFLNQLDDPENKIKSTIDTISDTIRDLSEKTVDAAKNYQKIAQKKPVLALGVAALAGCVLGMLIAKSSSSSED